MWLFKFLCRKKGHIYKFKQAWKASSFSFIDQEGKLKEIYFAEDYDSILKEIEVKQLVEAELEKYSVTRQHYLINLECKRCGHRVSVGDTLYNKKYYT